MTIQQRLDKQGPRKLLAIDGGGIRGVLALGVLEKIEQDLRDQSGRRDLVLADYFDYIAGTSTGGVIAAGLAVGRTVEDVLRFYQESGSDMFKEANLFQRVTRHKYEDEPLARKLREVLGADTTLDSPEVLTLLMLVLRNVTTDSPWPISNNPYARYNDLAHGGCNLKLPLWQLVRASMAAPTYFPPKVDRRRQSAVRVRRRRGDEVQQPRVPAVPHGDGRALRAERAGRGHARLGDRCRPDAAHLGRHRYEPVYP